MDGASAAIGGYRYTFIEAPVLQLLSSGEQKHSDNCPQCRKRALTQEAAAGMTRQTHTGMSL